MTVSSLDGTSLAGPTELPHRSAGEAAAVDRLRHHLRSSLSEQLGQRIRGDEVAGRPPMNAQGRRRFAEAILTDAAEAHARAELHNTAAGGMLVTPDVEQRLIKQVLDEVFGLAGLEPLLADHEIENININGERVF